MDIDDNSAVGNVVDKYVDNYMDDIYAAAAADDVDSNVYNNDDFDNYIDENDVNMDDNDDDVWD